MSVSVYQDGPDLANQGTICVSQSPVTPIAVNTCFLTGSGVIALPKTIAYTIEDKPNFLTSQSMPNSYFNRSRDGAYVPLKLTDTCQDWVTQADQVSIATLETPSDQIGYYTLPTVQAATFPFVDLLATRATTGYYNGQTTSCMLNGTWAHISAKNLSPQTSYSFFIRCGIEMQVSPNSVLAPQLKLSPAYDPQALETYFAIARELKDAYPVDYNDLGKMWDAISAAIADISPMLSRIPIYGQPIANLANGTRMIGDTIRTVRKKAPKQRKQQGGQSLAGLARTIGRDKPPQASVERAQDRRRAIAARPYKPTVTIKRGNGNGPAAPPMVLWETAQ